MLEVVKNYKFFVTLWELNAGLLEHYSDTVPIEGTPLPSLSFSHKRLTNHYFDFGNYAKCH